MLVAAAACTNKVRNVVTVHFAWRVKGGVGPGISLTIEYLVKIILKLEKRRAVYHRVVERTFAIRLFVIVAYTDSFLIEFSFDSKIGILVIEG